MTDPEQDVTSDAPSDVDESVRAEDLDIEDAQEADAVKGGAPTLGGGLTIEKNYLYRVMPKQ